MSMQAQSRRPLLRALVRAAVLGGLLQAGAASALTLMQAYQAALLNDPTYQGAVQDAAAGEEYRNIGRSALLPNLSASYSASQNRSDLRGEDLLGRATLTHPRYTSRSSSVTLRQPLFNLEALARYKQGLAQSDYSAAAFDSRTQEMILRVTSAYVDALFASEQVRIIGAQRATYLEQKRVNDRLFDKGEGTRTDMLETQSKLDLAEAQMLEALDNQAVQRATLATLVGQEVGELDELAPNFRVAALPEGGFEAWRKLALEGNPDLRAQVHAIESAKQEFNKSMAGHAPRVDVFASYTKANGETLNTYTQESTARAVGVQINVPLYSGGYVNAVSRQAQAGLEKARTELQAKTDKVLLDLRKQYTSVVSGVARIQALDRAVESGELLVKATGQSIKGGVRINLDLLNAQQQLTSVQRDLAQARYNYLMALLRLRTAAGTLTPADVGEVASYFR
jgi:protease secretion system outer membrane protein